MDIGIKNALGKSVGNPLPVSWLGRSDAPLTPPVMDIPQLSTTQIKTLIAQIGYDLSKWDYNKIGTHNELGRYQFTPATLEYYGLLAAGSNTAYGTDCVNYTSCWRPTTIRKNTSSYANYIYSITNLTEFLTSISSQEHLAYQVILDLYKSSLIEETIKPDDSADVVAGMITVAWKLGVGNKATSANSVGTGAYAWRYYNIGNGAAAYNIGRYAITVLSNPNTTTGYMTATPVLAGTPAPRTTYSLKITGVDADNTTIDVIVPIESSVSVPGLLSALAVAAPDTAKMATTTSFAIVSNPPAQEVSQLSDSAVNITTLPSLGSLTQGVTNSAMLSQQLQASAGSVVVGAIGSIAVGAIGSIAAGIGPNGGSIVNLVAAAIQNPSSALANVENMAMIYGTGWIESSLELQQVSSAFSDLITNFNSFNSQ